LAVVGLLLVLFAMTTLGARRTSLTYDEPIYIATGYSDLSKGYVRWHAVIGHPPLVNMLTAWPLLLSPSRPDPTLVPEWGSDNMLGFARALLPMLGPLEAVTFATRLPVMWLALVLGALVYRWARQAGGRMAGLLALGLFVLSPEVITHAQLNTTDMGLTVFAFIACYSLAQFLRRRSWPWLIMNGVATGLTFASKASGVYYVILYGSIIVVAALVLRKSPRRVPGLELAWVALWGILVWLVFWATYLFELRTLPGWTFPLPAASHWAGLPYIRSYMGAGQSTFLAGKLYPTGYWAYFPLAILVKTPLPILIGLAVAIGICIRRGLGPLWSALPLIAVPLVYTASAIALALNIGYRHLLPVWPFVFVFIGIQVARLQIPFKTGRTLYLPLGALLFTWYAWGTLHTWPYTLTYFNELAGGPDNGYRYLADSSVDWGQAIKGLREYVDRHNVRDLKLAAFTSLDPVIYDFSFERIPPTVGAPVFLPSRFNPAPGTYAISATPLQGIWALDPDTYDWFRHQTPVAKVGHAIFVYRVRPRDQTPTWVAQCEIGEPMLDSEQIASGFGRNDLRPLRFDCSQSWVYPDGMGWYVLPAKVEYSHDPFVRERLQDARLAFMQRQTAFGPAVAVYDFAGQVSLASRSKPVVVLDGPMNYLGNTVTHTVGKIELETFWQVTAVPTAPLSLMAHLVGADGKVLAVGDGLGVPPEQWQAGDVIVQRHILPLPDNLAAGTYRVRTGAYWILPDGVRSINVRPDPRRSTDDNVWLTPVEVKR